MAKEDVKSVTVLQSDDDFGGAPSTLYGKSAKRKKRKKKKQARALKPLEKAVFRTAKMYDKSTKEYRDRHERSNRKKKNGWIKDFPKNYSKAMSKLGMGGFGYMGIKLFE
ncbi:MULTISPECIES: hypothetical protein [Okeania]|uniref:Uncharacterized protein n=1 Tax=Okeania hirsuta TaxID=1458930 RepID=A0A3N6PE06_9CYAN|nr:MULTISPECIES: hypothetical protein [Okeania]NES92125.1 hypothetical protein [Okeania sp. SIO2B9]RQH29190.1 hypothetical protein D5R40_24910 [Okeania hirsuta]